MQKASFFAIKGAKERPNRKGYCVHSGVTSTPSWSKNNALRAAQYNISFNGIGPEFFELFQEGGPTAIKGSCGKVFNRTIPQIEVAKNSVKNQ